MVYYYAFDFINNWQNISIYNQIFFSEIAGIGEIDVNNLAKIEQLNIKVIDYYILLDHLYIYYYYFILAYYYPIHALNKVPYAIAMTSSRHQHDVTNSKSRSLTVSRCSAD